MTKTDNFLTTDEINPYVRYVNFRTFPAGTYLPERRIYDHEFIYCLSGETDFEYDGRSYRLKKGELFYIRPGICNTMIVPDKGPVKVHCVHFDWTIPDKTNDFLVENVYFHMIPDQNGIYIPADSKLLTRPNPELEPLSEHPLMSGLDSELLSPLFHSLYLNYRQYGQSLPLTQRALLLQIAAYLCETQYAATPTPEEMQKHIVLEALHYIEEYYSDNIDLSLLSKHAGLSAKYFGQLFIAQTGMSVHEYLNTTRITQAKYLLSHSGNNLEEIAALCGYRDKYYLSRVFKKESGMTPGQYRKLYH